MLNAVLRIGLYIILYLVSLRAIEYVTNSIIKNEEIQATHKEVEDEKAKYRGLLINSIKEFEEISRIKYPRYYHEYIGILGWDKDDIIDIKPQKLIILKRVTDGLLLVKCISDDTRCEFYADIHGKIYSEFEITPIGEYEKIREFTFKTEGFYDYLRK